MHPFSYQGWFWLPNESESAGKMVPGALTFNHNDGLILNLIGNLDNLGPRKLLSLGEIPAYQQINGRVHTEGSKIEYVTLFGCRVIDRNINLSDPDMARFKIWCELAYIGPIHLDNEHQPFQKLAIECTYLQDWIGKSNISHEYESVNAGLAHRVTYTPPTPYKIPYNGGEIQISSGLNSSSSAKGTVQLEESAHFFCVSATPLALGDWRNQFIAPLQFFLSLATGQSVKVINVTAYVKPEETEGNGRPGHDKPLRIVFARLDPSRGNYLFSENTIFLLGDVETRLEELFRLWFNFYEVYKDVCNLFFGARNNPRPDLSGRFLVLSQAAEIFHRQKFPRTAMPRKAFRNQKAVILQNVPEKYHKWLKEQLAWSNELTLKQRLTELFDHCGLILRSLVVRPEKFIERVKDTRNYYTHYNEGIRKNAATGAELHWLTVVLEYMLTCCMLYELGFSRSEVSQMLAKHRNFLHTRETISKAGFDW